MLMKTVMMMMLLGPRILVDAESMPSASFPFGSLSEAWFHEFLVSLCVESLIHLHGVVVFDEAKQSAPDTCGDMGGLCPYACLLKSLLLALVTAFLLGARINVHHTSTASDLYFILQKLYL
jgi:hypothetical protein